MNISSTVLESGIIFDRFLGKKLELPYPDFDYIKIQPNDIATHAVINLAFEKLYTNFLYLYKSSRVASNVIPISCTGFAGVSTNANVFRWSTKKDGLSTSQFRYLSAANLWGQDKITNIAACRNVTNNQFSIITTSGKDLVVYNADRRFFTDTIDYDLTITKVLSTKEIFPKSGVLWEGIGDIMFGDNNSMFVLDASAYNIRKYDASGFITDDFVLRDKFVYIDSIGGYGEYNDNNLFNDPRNIDVFNNELFVLDSGNGCVKRFDQDLNWKITYRLFRDFLSAYPVHLSHDANGNMYVLTDKNTILKYDNDFQNKVEIPIRSLSADIEKDIKLVFSEQNTNIFYLVTDKNIYKRLVSQPDQDVGRYLFYLHNVNTDETVVDFYTLSSASADFNIMFSRTPTGIGKFTLWYDNINLFDVLLEADFDVYTLDEITIGPEEYLQNWVFNKAISKLVISHQRLADHITGQFIAKKDYKGNITFRGTRYFLPEELAKIKFSQDLTFYIGMNEVFQNNIINRSLRKIFDIQVNMFNALQAEVFTGFADNETVFI